MTRLILGRSSLVSVAGKRHLMGLGFLRVGRWNLFQTREEDGEDCAVMVGRLTAADGDVSLVADDDLAADPEAESGAGRSLGGVEGLEEHTVSLRAHAAAGVGDGNPGTGSSGSRV